MLISEPTAEQSTFCGHFLEGVKQALGDNLYSFYLYGAMMFPRPAAWRVDVDFHVIVASPPDANTVTRIKDLHARLGREHPLGEELDGYYLLLEAATRKENPQNVVWTDTADFAWPLHRAHVHAGRFKLLDGKNPQEFLPMPEWTECTEGLECELQFIQSHPQYPQFGILNLSRLLLSWHNHDVVVSKYGAAQWALQNLEARWHPAIEAAVRDYEERARPGDLKLLEQALPEFQAYCESQIKELG